MAKFITIIGGEPASGKTTLMKKIISRLRIEIEIQHGLIKGYQDEASENYVLGIYQENELFAGTDKLSMAVQPDAIKFIKNKEFKHLLIEGDRLFKPSFIKECYNVRNNVRVIILKVGEMTLKNRHKQRGDNQSESWLRAKKTTVNNIKETFPCHILNNIDVFDQNICLEYIIGKDIYAQVNPSQTNLFI